MRFSCKILIKDYTQEDCIPYPLNGAITYFQFNIKVLLFVPGLEKQILTLNNIG